MREFIYLALFIFGFITVNAQDYKEGLVYDVSGNVKDLKLKTKNPYASKHVKFSKDGKCKISMTYFDDEYYPIGWNVSGFGMNMNYKIEYDNQRRITSITSSSTSSGGITNYCHNKYGNNTEDSSVITSQVFGAINKKGKSSITCEYSDYQYDNHNNWISRKVKQTSPDNDKIIEYTEIRKILYY